MVGLPCKCLTDIVGLPFMKEIFFFMQEAKRLNIHRTVHAGEAGPAANVKIVSIVKTKVF